MVHDERQAAQLKGTKPGTTLPIVIGDEGSGEYWNQRGSRGRGTLWTADQDDGRSLSPGKEKIGIILGEKNSQEMMDLIVHWCESKFNFAQTARLLNIHKNTLDYRFKKINSILEVDLQSFNDALAMYMVVTIYRMKGKYW